MRTKWYHCYMSRDLLYVIYDIPLFIYVIYVMQSHNLLKLHSTISTKIKTTNLGGKDIRMRW